MPPFVPGVVPHQAGEQDSEAPGAVMAEPADTVHAPVGQGVEPVPEGDPQPLNAEPWAGTVDLETGVGQESAEHNGDLEVRSGDRWPDNTEPDPAEPWTATGDAEPDVAEPWAAEADTEPFAAEPWAEADEAEPYAGEPWAEAGEAAPYAAEPSAQAPDTPDSEPWDAPDPWVDGIPEDPDVEPAGRADRDGAPTGALPEAFFADAFYTPHVMEESEVDEAHDAERVMAEQVAERLADLSKQIRERGFSALAETVDPDQLSRIIAGMVAGFVARADPDE